MLLNENVKSFSNVLSAGLRRDPQTGLQAEAGGEDQGLTVLQGGTRKKPKKMIFVFSCFQLLL